MSSVFIEAGAPGLIPIRAIVAGERALDALSEPTRRFAAAIGFKGQAGEVAFAPSQDGTLNEVLWGVGGGDDPWAFGSAAFRLPVGDYVLLDPPAALDADAAALAWALGAYRFDRYKKGDRAPARLAPPSACDLAGVERMAGAIALVRDLVNTPANDLGPEALQAAAAALADGHGARFEAVVGEALLDQNYPMIHAVGRAAHEAPRLLSLTWGRPDAPRLTIVGKGVTFDSGGLDIKPGDGMRLMKKDMGGAAHALGLAQLVMRSGLDCRLSVLVPTVENAISAGAFRPGDILTSRAGLTVEIENTDAEGRLILGDALARAAEDEPGLIIDFATLTGAARVALGPEVPPYFTNDDAIARDLETASAKTNDPVWRLPLWRGYERAIESPIADLKNLGDGPFAGSIAAALFLQRFVKSRPWLHFDVFAWNPASRPGRPKGGEAQALRATFELVRDRFGVRA